METPAISPEQAVDALKQAAAAEKRRTALEAARFIRDRLPVPSMPSAPSTPTLPTLPAAKGAAAPVKPDEKSVAKAGDRATLLGRLRGYRRIARTLHPTRAALPAGEALS